MTLIHLFALISVAAGGSCRWCVETNKSIEKAALKLAALKPAEQLAAVRSQKICVKVLASNRPAPAGVFRWGSVEPAKGNLNEITQQKGLMGKTLCKGETPLSSGCTTIVLADDAPRSTLLHEYLHVRQSQLDPKWCPLSKKLWKRGPTTEEFRAIREKEWDVHKLLWRDREKLGFDFEDKVAVTSETLEEAKARMSYDFTAADFVKREDMNGYLGKLITEYKRRIGIK